MRKNRRLSAMVLLSMMILSSSISASAETINVFENAVVKNAYIENVSNDGANLKNVTLDHDLYSDIKSVNVNGSYVGSNVKLDINIDGSELQINGLFSGVNDNGNVLLYRATTDCLEYDIVHLSVEKNIEDSILYFNQCSSEYNSVAKIYLREKDTSNYVMIEAFNVELPSNVYTKGYEGSRDDKLLQFWYAKEFSPIEPTEGEEFASSSEGKKQWEEKYEFSNLGVIATHYITVENEWDAPNIIKGGEGECILKLRLAGKGIRCPGYPNEQSTTYSALSLKNVSIEAHTRPGLGIRKLKAQGNVWRYGGVSFDFTAGVSIGRKGVSVDPSLNIGLQFDANYASGTDTKYYSNTSLDNLVRDATAALDTNSSLNAVNNEYVVSVYVKDYQSIVSSSGMIADWKYFAYNDLSYVWGKSGVKSEFIPQRVV